MPKLRSLAAGMLVVSVFMTGLIVGSSRPLKLENRILAETICGTGHSIRVRRTDGITREIENGSKIKGTEFITSTAIGRGGKVTVSLREGWTAGGVVTLGERRVGDKEVPECRQYTEQTK
ncbi:hypothetical protein HZC08_01150 [Candidatus Micrarchaeota archaeon]|nr:hypothetical protein [Candidatus Micrarchaeota archaeon]